MQEGVGSGWEVGCRSGLGMKESGREGAGVGWGSGREKGAGSRQEGGAGSGHERDGGAYLAPYPCCSHWP